MACEGEAAWPGVPEEGENGGHVISLARLSSRHLSRGPAILTSSCLLPRLRSAPRAFAPKFAAKDQNITPNLEQTPRTRE